MNAMTGDAQELKRRYEEFAQSLDYRTTACDHQLRELEIDTASAYMRDGMTTLDVGCGLGYAVTQYASRFRVVAHGIDYSDKMIEGARKLLQKHCSDLVLRVDFRVASVTDLPYTEAMFDVVTSHRCLMALLDWELQKKALLEIYRVLKPGGLLVLMEGTFDGLERLNRARASFGLEAIPPDGRERLLTLKFHESQLLEFCEPHFKVERIQRFGMYYFLTRVIQPLLVFPDKPSYDHKLNQVAREVARVIPDYDGMGHLVAFVLSKRRQRDQ
jgi:ubiquinone/menaquinone biosynthesis C-methylase UbiE